MSIKGFQGKQNSHQDYQNSNDFSSGKMSDNQLYQIKQSAYFHHEKKLDPLQMRFAEWEDRISQLEQHNDNRFEHLEERVKQINQKFERIEQLGERLESLNKLIDTLKTNFDAKLMVYEDKINLAQQKLEKKISSAKSELIERIKNDPSSSSECSRSGKIRDGSSTQEDIQNEIQQLYQVMKRIISTQKDLQNDVQSLKSQGNAINKERDIRQSDLIFNNIGNLKQSNIQQQQQVQSPTNHQRIDSYKAQFNGTPAISTSQSQQITSQKNDRVRSITLEKEKQQLINQEEKNHQQRPSKKEIPLPQQYLISEEDEADKKSRSKSRKAIQQQIPNENIDKYQFTLQSKVLQNIDTNHQKQNPIETVGQIIQANTTTSQNSQAVLKNNSQQSRVTFNFKEEINYNRDRVQSKGSGAIMNPKEFKQSMLNAPNNPHSKQHSEQLESGKSRNQQSEKQSLLERAVSQESFSRSKYLTQDKMKMFKQDDENDILQKIQRKS